MAPFPRGASRPPWRLLNEGAAGDFVECSNTCTVGRERKQRQMLPAGESHTVEPEISRLTVSKDTNLRGAGGLRGHGVEASASKVRGRLAAADAGRRLGALRGLGVRRTRAVREAGGFVWASAAAGGASPAKVCEAPRTGLPGRARRTRVLRCVQCVARTALERSSPPMPPARRVRRCRRRRHRRLSPSAVHPHVLPHSKLTHTMRSLTDLVEGTAQGCGIITLHARAAATAPSAPR